MINAKTNPIIVKESTKLTEKSTFVIFRMRKWVYEELIS
jgi:hypothetical protein